MRTLALSNEFNHPPFVVVFLFPVRVGKEVPLPACCSPFLLGLHLLLLV